MPSLTPRSAVTGIAVGRLLAGAGLLAQPGGALASGWVGAAEAERGATQLLFRSVGARDAGIALGTLAALRRGDALHPWVLGAALADGVDLVATVAARRHIPRAGLVAVGLIAAGTAAAELAIARALR